ncbi:MAG: hypothetical protein ACJ76F_12315 [Bacteroidia bacterium]
MRKNSLSVLCILLMAGLLISSCKKNKVDNEVQSVIDNALCEQEFMRIPIMFNARAIQAVGIKKVMPGYSQAWSGTCPKDSVVGDTSGYAAGSFTNSTNLPGMQLDWGSGCADQVDGVSRSGKLSGIFTKPWSQAGSVVTITPLAYKAGNISYSGTIKVTRTAPYVFTVEVTGGKCSEGGATMEWNCNRTITWISGMGDTNEQNDVFEISGNASGVNREGKAFSVVITSSLNKAADCKWISRGVLEVSPDGLKTRVVDYGDGTCNATATFTVNGNTYTFNMQ